MPDEFLVNDGGQILYLPKPRSERDLLLAGEVLLRSGYSVLWVSWTHRDGPVRATGPFPYDVSVIPYDEWEGPEE